MRYGEVCNAALQLMNQFSLAGDTIPESYNNQADYFRRMAPLVDDAQLVIARGPRPIRAARKLVLERGKDEGPYLRYILPEDMLEIMPGGLFTYLNHEKRHLHLDHMEYQSGYARLDEKRILLPKEWKDLEIWLEYYRRPQSVLTCVNEGLTLIDADVEVPDGATAIMVAGNANTRPPALSTVSGDTATEVTLTKRYARSLNGETGAVKMLNEFLKRDYELGTADISGAATVRISGWAKPGDAVYCFVSGTEEYNYTPISFAAAPTEPDPDMELDNAPETHQPIPYYVAAYLLMPEDAFAYSALYNQWQNLLGSLYQQPQPSRDIVEDAYFPVRSEYDTGASWGWL